MPGTKGLNYMTVPRRCVLSARPHRLEMKPHMVGLTSQQCSNGQMRLHCWEGDQPLLHPTPAFKSLLTYRNPTKSRNSEYFLWKFYNRQERQIFHIESIFTLNISKTSLSLAISHLSWTNKNRPRHLGIFKM